MVHVRTLGNETIEACGGVPCDFFVVALHAMLCDGCKHNGRRQVTLEQLMHADQVLRHEAPRDVRQLTAPLQELLTIDHRHPPPSNRAV